VDLTGVDWRKSTRSNGPSQCVEFAKAADAVAVRDSKNPGPALIFTPTDWATFIQGVKGGEFDQS
jgi:hypothetical protein